MGTACFGVALLLTMLSVGSIPEEASGIIFFATLLGMLGGGIMSYIRTTVAAKGYMMFVGSLVGAVLVYILIQIVFLAAHDSIMSYMATNPRVTLERITVALIALGTFVPGAQIGLRLRGR